MQKVERLLHLIDTISEWSGKIVSPLIIFVMAIIMYEIVARYAFNAPTIWAHETSAFVYGAHFILGGGYALRHGEHVNVDVLYGRFPPRMRAITDLVTSILFYLFCGVLLWAGVEMAWRSLRLLETSQTIFSPPVYPIRLMIPLGAFLILLQGSAKFIRDFIMAITGRPEYEH